MSSCRCLSISCSISRALSLQRDKARNWTKHLYHFNMSKKKRTGLNLSSSCISSISLDLISSKYFSRACLMSSFFCLHAVISYLSLDLSLINSNRIMNTYEELICFLEFSIFEKFHVMQTYRERIFSCISWSRLSSLQSVNGPIL
jgi:hypothetical protein